jgi:hypothetical protein
VNGFLRYLCRLTVARFVLWAYLIWYLAALVRYFDPSLPLWLNSLGISAIIGTGLVLSTAYAGSKRTALDRWQIFRLYVMPFCVSSFAALIKGRGFILVFHPTLGDNAIAFGLVAAFGLVVLGARALGGATSSGSASGAPLPSQGAGGFDTHGE